MKTFVSMKTLHNIRCTDDYKYGNGEFNLLKMYDETITKAMRKHNRIEEASAALGISNKTLYRFMDTFGTRNLLLEQVERRKLIAKNKLSIAKA